MNLFVPFEENKFYHVFNHANGKDNLFRNDENYSFFLKKYAEYLFPFVDTFAYCLMPNHFHLLIKVRDKSELISDNIDKNKEMTYWVSNAFQRFFTSYSKSYNKVFERKGNLLMHKVKRKEVMDKNQFIATLNYIHFNPVNHNFVTEIEDWQFSSYNSYFYNKPTKLNREYVFDCIKPESNTRY